MSGNPFEQRQHKPSNPYRLETADVKNYTFADYGLTADQLKLHHFGIKVTDPNTDEELTTKFYEYTIESAVAQVEKELDIVILPRIEVEPKDYYKNDFENFMYMHTNYKPIIQVEEFKMVDVNGGVRFSPDRNWWKVYPRFGHIKVMPSLLYTNSGFGEQSMFVGVPSFQGLPNTMGGNGTNAPQMFEITYVAGMLPQQRKGVQREWEFHPDLFQLIMKMAQKEIMQQFGRLIIGAGIADMSISIDGVSQSIGTTQSAMYGGASADILQLNEDIDKLVTKLIAYYGFNLGIL